MEQAPALHVALTRAEVRRGVLLVTKDRLPLDEPLSVEMTAQAQAQARAATEAEARWLVAARDPGVVPLRRVEVRRARLSTRHVGAASLATIMVNPAVAADLLGSLALTVHRLHAGQLVHGAVRADHVILATRRPCGGSAQRGLRGPLQPVLCSPRPKATEPGDDVQALIDLAGRWRDRVRSRGYAWDQALDELNEATNARQMSVVLFELSGRLRARRRSTELAGTFRATLKAARPDTISP